MIFKIMEEKQALSDELMKCAEGEYTKDNPSDIAEQDFTNPHVEELFMFQRNLKLR